MTEDAITILPKARAFDVTLSNGMKLVLHEPLGKDMGTLLKALPSISMMQTAISASEQAAQGVLGVVVNLPDTALEGLYCLLASMANLSLDEIKSLPLWDVVGMFGVLTELIPKNPRSPQPDSAK